MPIKDLIEDWIQMRSTLSRQLTALKSGLISAGDDMPGATIEMTIVRIEAWIAELNDLLKHYSSARQD